MIYFLTKRVYDHTVRREVIASGALRSQFRLLSYESLFRRRSLHVGTYIFSDLERLSDEDTEKAAIVWNAIENHPEGRTVNHPIRSMRRFELLRTLHSRGRNSFNAFRLTEPLPRLRYPVFIRPEDEHRGSVTPLLNSAEELDQAVEQLVSEGHSRDNKLVIEFCDVSDQEGIYHWYGAFRVGNEIIPSNVSFLRHWGSKDPDHVLKEARFEDAQAAYIEKNPHADTLLEIFDLARIEYGRIDYAVLDGEVQVFEINTNPWSLPAERLLPAIAPLQSSGSGRIPVRIPRLIRKPTPGALLEQRRLRRRAILSRLHLLGLRTKLSKLLRREGSDG